MKLTTLPLLALCAIFASTATHAFAVDAPSTNPPAASADADKKADAGKKHKHKKHKKHGKGDKAAPAPTAPASGSTGGTGA